jgi:hypothetical protein
MVHHQPMVHGPQRFRVVSSTCTRGAHHSSSTFPQRQHVPTRAGVVWCSDASEGTRSGAGSLADSIVLGVFGLEIALEIRVRLLVPVQGPEDEDADTDVDDRIPVHVATEVGDHKPDRSHQP